MEKSAAIIQTSAVSSAELAQLCAELLPGVRIHQIIDDSLIREVNANCGPTPGVRRRMYAYYQSAQSLGVDAILNQCSSVGEVADQIAPFVDVPVVRIDEAMAREAVRLGKKIGLVATVESTVGPSGRLIERAAREAGKEIRLSRRLVQGAMMELIEHKNVEKHNAMVLGEVEAAAKAAQAHDFIMSFPNGYDTWIEQGGVNVSGGQKQRLCIARALLKKPPILILDDSTSAVDTATERRIRDAFNAELSGTTKFIIAQRISSVKDADQIIILSDGEIADAGTHDELLARSEEYREIYYSQQEKEADA